MFKNYLLTAIRNISKRGVFSVINIAGLAIGMACSILILMWVHHELRFDRFHPDHENIQRIAFRLTFSGTTMDGPVAMAPLAASLKEIFPEVEDVVRIHKLENVNLGIQTEHFIEPLVLMADSSFFQLFGFELETGDPGNVLKTPFSIVITKKLAEKYFGEKNPVGETIALNNNHDYTITGVAADPPPNSHISFDAITSFETLYETSSPGAMYGWLSLSYYTYIKFKKHFSEDRFFSRLNDLFEERFGEEAREFGIELVPYLQPVASIYLDSNTPFELTASGNKASVKIFLAVALFILLLACINFMNLSTAKASLRSKEVGVRKVSGASRFDLIQQFIGESLSYTFIALVLAIPLIEIALPFFNNITNVQLSFFNSGNLLILLGLPVFVLITGIFAGSYPAFILSGLSPSKTIKGEKQVSSGRSWIRSGLTVFQMVISITLVISTIFIWKQLAYINSKDPGYEKHNKIIVPLITGNLRSNKDVLKQELVNLSGVKDISFSNSYPGIDFNGTKYKPQGFDQEIVGRYINIDNNYLDLMNIKLSRGRNFDPSFYTDTMAVLVNETAVREFGWSDPLNMTIDRSRSENEFDNYKVIGVVKDFHFMSLHQQVEPLVIHLLKYAPRYMTIDIEPAVLPSAILSIKSRWEEINPDDPFEFTALSDAYDAHYRSENQLSKVFVFFTVLALIIAALGLFGLTSFMVESKTKEVGIRKVFGASVSIIVLRFFKSFGLWLVMANIISWTIAWYVVNYWLDAFAYKIPVNNPLVFLGAALASIVVVLLAAGYQTIRAAYLNPADSLRYE